MIKMNSKNQKELILEIKNLEKQYQADSGSIVILSNINLQVIKNSVISIIGASGSGKTTLFNLLGGLDKPTNGKIIYRYKTDILQLDDELLSELRSSEIAFVFQNFGLLQEMNVYENIELPLIISGAPIPPRKKKISELLDQFGILDKINHRPDQLSGGERQRVAIARSLINNPSLPLLDEPTGDLDQETSESFHELIKQSLISKELTVIVFTHDLKLAQLADNCYLLKNGVLNEVNIDEVENYHDLYSNNMIH